MQESESAPQQSASYKGALNLKVIKNVFLQE